MTATADGDHYPYSPEQIRQRRLARRVGPIDNELNRLTYERSEIQAELRRVQDIHARHLERILRMAHKNTEGFRALAARTEQLS